MAADKDEALRKALEVLVGWETRMEDGEERRRIKALEGEIESALLPADVRVVITVQGGLVQGASTDTPSVEVRVRDYDINEDEEDGKDENGQVIWAYDMMAEVVSPEHLAKMCRFKEEYTED